MKRHAPSHPQRRRTASTPQLGAPPNPSAKEQAERADKLTHAFEARSIADLLWWVLEDHKRDLLLRQESPHGKALFHTALKEVIQMEKNKLPVPDEDNEEEDEEVSFLSVVGG